MSVLKELFLPALLLTGICSIAQTGKFTVNNVDQMAVYPGCDKSSTNKELTDCFTKKLSSELINAIDISILEKEFDNKKDGNFSSKAMLTITKNGKIDKIEVVGDEKLNNLVKLGLAKINEDFNTNNTYIIPAKDNKGNNVDLAYSLPVRLSFQ